MLKVSLISEFCPTYHSLHGTKDVQDFHPKDFRTRFEASKIPFLTQSTSVTQIFEYVHSKENSRLIRSTTRTLQSAGFGEIGIFKLFC